MDPVQPLAEVRTGSGSRWKPILGYLFAAALLVWVFHDIHLERLAGSVSAINWWWVLAAVACDVLGYFCDGIRWHYLLRPSGRLSPLRATQAIYAGLFTNEVLPMRFGELVRIYLAGRWTGLRLSDVVPSMLVSRLLDAAWMAVGIAVTAILVPLPENLLLGGDLLGAAVLIVVVAFVYLVVARPAFVTRWAQEPSGRHGLAKRLLSLIARIASGVQKIGNPRLIAFAAAYSLLFLALQAMAFWLVMVACRLPTSAAAGMAVFLIVHLGTAVPSAPANVGSYQFFTVVGLTLFGVDKTRAAGFSVIVFLILTVPLWVLGLLALSRAGLTLREIRADLNRLRQREAGR